MREDPRGFSEHRVRPHLELRASRGALGVPALALQRERRGGVAVLTPPAALKRGESERHWRAAGVVPRREHGASRGDMRDARFLPDVHCGAHAHAVAGVICRRRSSLRSYAFLVFGCSVELSITSQTDGSVGQLVSWRVCHLDQCGGQGDSREASQATRARTDRSASVPRNPGECARQQRLPQHRRKDNAQAEGTTRSPSLPETPALGLTAPPSYDCNPFEPADRDYEPFR